MLVENGNNFEIIAQITTMLIENINMQMESELVDMNDRKLMGVYAGQLPANSNGLGNLTMEDVTLTSKAYKATRDVFEKSNSKLKIKIHSTNVPLKTNDLNSPEPVKNNP